jgi:hypothetical protein
MSLEPSAGLVGALLFDVFQRVQVISADLIAAHDTVFGLRRMTLRVHLCVFSFPDGLRRIRCFGDEIVRTEDVLVSGLRWNRLKPGEWGREPRWVMSTQR